MRELIFTLMVTLSSRALMKRDRMRGLPRPVSPGPGVRCGREPIVSGRNVLDSMLVEPVEGQARAALLICHGIGETVEHWLAAQVVLAELGVASLVFNYSGYGRSTGSVSAKQCEHDALAAYARLEQRIPGVRVSLLGFSLGSGLAAAVASRVTAYRLVLCAVFPSLHGSGCRAWGSRTALASLLPRIWNTEEAVRTLTVPVIIVQGERDRLFPPQLARRVAEACVGPCEMLVVPGLTHNGPISRPHAAYWALIADRIADRDSEDAG